MPRLTSKPFLALAACLVVALVAVAAAFLLLSPRKQSQQISIDMAAQVTYGEGPVAASARATSGLAVQIAIGDGPCSLEGDFITLHGAGSCLVIASQAGNSRFNEAEASHLLTVARRPQRIDFEAVPARSYGEPPFQVIAVSDSGLPVAFAAAGSCTVAGLEVTLTSAGMCGLTASQGGDDDYLPAHSVTQEFRVYNITLDVGSTTEYYLVFALNTDEIFAEMESNGPRLDGTPVLGLTSAKATKDWGTTSSGGTCGIESMTISMSLTMTIPEHTQSESLSAPIRARWDAFVAAVDRHEQTHADIYSEGVSRIREAMVAIPTQRSCQALDVEIERVWDEQNNLIEELQDKFHAEEDARVEALRAPIKAQIDAHQARLDSLRSQIDADDAELSGIDGEISGIENRMATLESQLNALERSYPNGAPADVVDRYNAMVDEYNGLVARHNQLVATSGALIDERNEAGAEYNQLIALINSLAEEHDWLY